MAPQSAKLPGERWWIHCRHESRAAPDVTLWCRWSHQRRAVLHAGVAPRLPGDRRPV